MTRFISVAMILLFAGCATEQPSVAPAIDVFRDRSAQIASQTNVSAEKMAGDWVIRQRFAGQPGPQSGLELSSLPGGALQLSVLGGDCAQDVCFETETLVLLEPRGPGRWAPVGEQTTLFDAEIWVLWMDVDARTAAIGTPGGQFGWIIDKNLTGGADRIAAARDIMDWFGYDVARLEEVPL